MPMVAVSVGVGVVWLLAPVAVAEKSLESGLVILSAVVAAGFGAVVALPVMRALLLDIKAPIVQRILRPR